MSIRVAVIIPDRGDRKEFLLNCGRMLTKQTLCPWSIDVFSEPPKSDECDITYRYRMAYSKIKHGMVDVIAFMENDDYYAPDYLETMSESWERHGRPDLFGTSYTIYYHIGLKKYFKFEHFDRSSMMNTFIKPGMEVGWPADTEPYTDTALWANQPHLKKAVWTPDRHLSIGIKHGVGKTGGAYHKDKMERWRKDGSMEDFNSDFLRSVLDTESFKFYSGVLQ